MLRHMMSEPYIELTGISRNFWEHLYYRTPLGGYFWIRSSIYDRAFLRQLFAKKLHGSIKLNLNHSLLYSQKFHNSTFLLFLTFCTKVKFFKSKFLVRLFSTSCRLSFTFLLEMNTSSTFPYHCFLLVFIRVSLSYWKRTPLVLLHSCH